MPECRFRKRPVVVAAIRWTGENEAELTEWTGRKFFEIAPEDRGDDPEKTGELMDDRHSTWVGLRPGDWVVRLPDGDVIALTAEQFEADYEPHGPTDAPAAEMPAPDYLPGYPGKLAARPAFLDPEPEAVTPEAIATYYLDHCGNCRDAEFYGRAWGHGNPHDRHVPVIEDGHGPLAGTPCKCKTCVPAPESEAADA